MQSSFIAILILALLQFSSSTNYVVFRLDDIQDYWIDDAQQAVINVFKNAQLPMTVGIIANEFGTDSAMVNFIKECIQTPNFGIEIANHGYNHEDFTTFSESQQQNLLSESKAKTVSQLSPLISDITTFIPPYDSFNDNTFTALQATGFNAMSSDISFYGYDDNGDFSGPARAYPGSGPIREYPAGSGTNDLYDQYVIPVSTSMQMIQAQIASVGFSVVMMHFNWYSAEAQDGTTSVNQTMITMLQQLIQECQSAGYEFTTIGGLTQALSSGTASTSSSTTAKLTPATTGKSSPATTGKASPATTGKASPATTGKASPATTGKSTPATTGKASPATTGKATPATTGKASQVTTGKASPATTGSAATATSTSSSSCTNGNMRCTTSETYETCDHDIWSAMQSCQTGLTCHPSGNYVYCY